MATNDTLSLTELKARLARYRGSIPQLAKAADGKVSQRWIYAMREGVIQNPGFVSLQALAQALDRVVDREAA